MVKGDGVVVGVQESARCSTFKIWSLNEEFEHPSIFNGRLLAGGLSTVKPPKVIQRIMMCPIITPAEAP